MGWDLRGCTKWEITERGRIPKLLGGEVLYCTTEVEMMGEVKIEGGRGNSVSVRHRNIRKEAGRILSWLG